MTVRGLIAALTAAALGAIAAAGAAAVEPAVPVTITLGAPPGFGDTCCLAASSGAWLGPEYLTAQGAPTAVRARIDWWLAPHVRASGAAAAARAALTPGFSVVEAGVAFVPHVVRGRAVGSIPASLFVARRPGTAQYELTLAMALHGSRFARVRLSVSGRRRGDRVVTSAFLVEGVGAPAWNKSVLDVASRSVKLEGSLPPAHVSLGARRVSVAGVVRDVHEHPVAGARVVLERRAGTGWAAVRRGRAGVRGTFELPRPTAAGLYRVSATLAGIAARSPTRRL